MSDKSKLDSYLENLGISDEAETGAPRPAVSPPPPPAISPLERPAAAPTGGRLQASGDAIVEDFLSGLLQRVGHGYKVSARPRGGDTIQAEIQGGDLGRIIGREGRTLGAVEFLANTVLAKEIGGGAPRVHLDAAGYRRRHEERLLETAQRASARVRKTGEPFEMDPMSAADRRVIHIALRDNAHVLTESVGEGKERRLIIKAR